MKQIQSKLKALEWSHHISHNKYVCSSDAIVPVPGPIWPNFKPIQILWASLLPERTKKIRSKMKALEWSQQYLFIFFSDAQW